MNNIFSVEVVRRKIITITNSMKTMNTTINSLNPMFPINPIKLWKTNFAKKVFLPISANFSRKKISSLEITRNSDYLVQN